MERNDEEGIIGDAYTAAAYIEHTGGLPPEEESQPTQSIEPLSLMRGALESYRRHREGAKQLGALCIALASAGFATGALVFHHR